MHFTLKDSFLEGSLISLSQAPKSKKQYPFHCTGMYSILLLKDQCCQIMKLFFYRACMGLFICHTMQHVESSLGLQPHLGIPQEHKSLGNG